jgi:hypothetical protein
MRFLYPPFYFLRYTFSASLNIFWVISPYVKTPTPSNSTAGWHLCHPRYEIGIIKIRHQTVAHAEIASIPATYIPR